MITDWRPGYATFLAGRVAVPDHKIRYYVHWVERFLAFVPPAVDPREAVPRFLDLLGREKEPWQVQQAQEAVQLYAQFRAEPPTVDATEPGRRASGGPPACAASWARATASGAVTCSVREAQTIS